jgi:hypothetical protein
MIKEWVINKLKECNLDVDEVKKYENYEQFVRETGSTSSKRSYDKEVSRQNKRLRGKTVNQQMNYNQESDDGFTPGEYKEEELTAILEEEIRERGEQLKQDDIRQLAYRKGIPFRAFLYEIPDLDKVLSRIYKLNLFHIENDKEIEKLKKNNKVLQKELNHYKESVQKDEELIEAINQVAEVYEPLPTPQVNINTSSPQRALVALASDWHWDERVIYEQMHGINEYNLDIAKARIDQYCNSIIENGKDLKTDTLYLKMLGDMISGDLHDLAENNELTTATSVIQLTDYVAQWIRQLGQFFSSIYVLGLVGNHPRTVKKPPYKNKQHKNYEYILYEMIRRETRDIVDYFDIPESYFRIHDILGFNFLSVHGDTIRGGNGLNSIPGNLSRDISLFSGTLGRKNITFQYVDLAHFHSTNETQSFSGAEIIMNGSLIGPNDFSLGAMKKGEPPSQTTYVVEEGTGVRFIDHVKIQ